MAKKKTKEVEDKIRDPFVFEHLQFDIHIGVYPEKDGERRVAIGISSHGDLPKLKIFPNWDDLLEHLPAQIETMIHEFKEDLPRRHLDYLARNAESNARKKRTEKKETPEKLEPEKPGKKTSGEQLGMFGGKKE